MASYVSHNYGSGPSTAFLGLEETRGQETVSLTSDGKLPCKDPPGQMTEAFRISDISGRGRGLIAARNIQEVQNHATAVTVVGCLQASFALFALYHY